MEAFRFEIMDKLPDLRAIYKPFSFAGDVVANFKSYETLTQENKELRRQLRQMEAWREAALQYEQINAELRSLNNLKFTPKANYITGDIIGDSGGPFSQTALINVGEDKNIQVGAPALDGFGLVGRIVGVGADSSRIMLLNDPTSHISALIMPDRIRAIVKGNNSLELDLVLIDTGARVLAGSRVVTSGEGILPADLPIGYVNVDANEQTKVKIAADYNALEFARILIEGKLHDINDTADVIAGSDNSETTSIGEEISEPDTEITEPVADGT